MSVECGEWSVELKLPKQNPQIISAVAAIHSTLHTPLSGEARQFPINNHQHETRE